MKAIRTTLILTVLGILTALQSHGGVKVSDAESDQQPPVAVEKEKPVAGPAERTVAMRLADGSFVTASPNGTLDQSGVKIGSKQTFTIDDVNGGELADGDEVRIRYTPNSGGVPDPAKATYWRLGKEGVIRKREGDTFKIKKVDSKYAFQTQDGKFVTGKVVDGALALSDKQESALVVEFVDVNK